MSVQFGKWNFDGKPLASGSFDQVSRALAPYGPDSNDAYSKDGIKILYRAFCTTKESWREKQPHTSGSGLVITWDGRLDNRAPLIHALKGKLTNEATDVEIVTVAYEEWGQKCFAKLIGDWALSIWNPSERTLLLAKDQIGTKHLYYSFDQASVTWSTVLDPLVLYAGKPFGLCEEYIASWFTLTFPPSHLTPYANVHSVPASSLVIITPEKEPRVCKYWDFNPGYRIRYRTDAEYEEHFRTIFGQAVRRRLRSDRPVLAELSGGMDSSSIVCMADLVMGSGEAVCSRLDTISWFDDTYDQIEPDMNELPWIVKVEEKRGRPGWHINLREIEGKSRASSQESFAPEFDDEHFAVTPHSNGRRHPMSEEYEACLKSGGYRVTLAGIGGDEPTGAEVPTPVPELQDLIARARFVALVRRLNQWAAKMKVSRLSLLLDAVREFFQAPAIDLRCSPPYWLHPKFVRNNRAALKGEPTRTKLFGPLPSFQKNIIRLNGTRAVLGCFGPSAELVPGREQRLPFMDRDFLEFMYAIPRDQVVGVGKRRFLMKRAMAGIVPDELLNRRRKNFVPPESEQIPAQGLPASSEIGQKRLCDLCGITEPNRFEEALQQARSSNGSDLVNDVKRTLTLEFWLRNLAIHGVLSAAIPPADLVPRRHSTDTNRLQAVQPRV